MAKKPEHHPPKLTATQAAKLNQEMAKERRLAAQWVSEFNRLPARAQIVAYNLLITDAESPFGRLDQLRREADGRVAGMKEKYSRGGRKQHEKNAERDAEIVRLRDKKKLTFGQIAKRFKITRDAAEKVYHRSRQAEGWDILSNWLASHHDQQAWTRFQDWLASRADSRACP